MRISGGLENVNKIEATLTIIMTLGEWQELQKQLATAWPSWKLGEAIGKLWTKARHEYGERLEDQRQ